MAQVAQLASKAALSGVTIPRNGPFTSSRGTPRVVMVRSQQGQGPTDAAIKAFGAIAAAQIALMPLSGAALAADPLGKAKSAVAPNPIETLQSKSKTAAKDAKASLASNGLAPDPVKDLKQKSKAVAKNVTNPAAEYANKGKNAVKQAAPAAKKAVNKAKASNPAKEFAAKSQAAKNKIASKTGVPVLTIGGWNTADLQQQVLFGFGNKKTQDSSSFSIFNADSVQDARKQLKENLDEAVTNPDNRDPAERVVSVGKPGESQEENAERVRREAENTATPGGDAREPTN